MQSMEPFHLSDFSQETDFPFFIQLGFQQIAMVQLPFFGIIRNALLLIFAGKLRAFFAILFALAAVGAALWFYEFFVFILLLGAPVLTVMTFNLIFLPVFEAFFPEDEDA